MDWLSFVGGIIGSLIGGFSTYWGVRATIKHELKLKEQEKIELAYREMPRLSIVNKVVDKNRNDLQNGRYDCSFVFAKICNIRLKDDHAFVEYNADILDKKKLRFVDVDLENIGKTEIKEIYISCNTPNRFSILETHRVESYLNQGFINCCIDIDKIYIKTNDHLKLRSYFNKEDLKKLYFGDLIFIWMVDIYGRVWYQKYDIQSNKIEIPRLTTYKNFLESTNEDEVLKYLEKKLKNQKSH